MKRWHFLQKKLKYFLASSYNVWGIICDMTFSGGLCEEVFNPSQVKVILEY